MVEQRIRVRIRTRIHQGLRQNHEKAQAGYQNRSTLYVNLLWYDTDLSGIGKAFETYIKMTHSGLVLNETGV